MISKKKSNRSQHKAALYLRVSTGEQSTDMQERELRDAAEAKGLDIVKVYSDAGISGAKSRAQRPGLDLALADAVRGKYGVLMVWSIDRLGRSLVDLLATLQELHSAGADLYSAKQAIDTRTPSGKMLYQLLGAFAEFERSMIQERVRSGIARAKAQGVVFGPPKVSADVEQQVRKLRATGLGINKTARQLGIGVSVVQRIEREDRERAT